MSSVLGVKSAIETKPESEVNPGKVEFTRNELISKFPKLNLTTLQKILESQDSSAVFRENFKKNHRELYYRLRQNRLFGTENAIRVGNLTSPEKLAGMSPETRAYIEQLWNDRNKMMSSKYGNIYNNRNFVETQRYKNTE